MSQLYTQLSAVYQAMYKSFINYEEEFDFYNGILAKYQCKSVIEIGCGTGNLAQPFSKSGVEYTGLDLSEEMLQLARLNDPRSVFMKADMRNFTLPQQKESCIITGRTISYLISNQDVLDAFYSINRNIKHDAILCFDFINANTFVPSMQQEIQVVHKATDQSKKYQRTSLWKMNNLASWTFDWESVYYEELEEGQLLEIGQDHSIIRTFTKDDMHLFLSLSGFEVLEMIPRASYAFDTLVAIAQKKKHIELS